MEIVFGGSNRLQVLGFGLRWYALDWRLLRAELGVYGAVWVDEVGLELC